jgi:hypothetical protein
MPIKHASIKDLRKSKRAYLRNQKVRDSLETEKSLDSQRRRSLKKAVTVVAKGLRQSEKSRRDQKERCQSLQV